MSLFRFQPILDLRRRERDEAGAAVGQAMAAIEKIEAQIAQLEADRASARQIEIDQRRGDVAVERLLDRGRYDLQQQAELAALRDTLAKLNREADRRRERLIACESEVKKYGHLRERHEAARAERDRHAEQIELDEIAARRVASGRVAAAANFVASTRSGDSA